MAVDGWDDEDRADAALQRLAERLHAGRRVRNGVNGSRLPAAPDVLPPSPRELEVLTCASHGLTTDMTAEVLGCSYETVKHHLKCAQRRLAAKNRTHAVACALREGLIP